MIVGVPTCPKARKEHCCWWCSEVIEKGEIYERWNWVDQDGLFMVLKAHKECKSAWDTLDFEDSHHVGFGEHSKGEIDQR